MMESENPKKPTAYTLSVCCEAHGTTCHTKCIY